MANPFDSNNTDAYLRWREHKLAHAITDPLELIVEVKDPAALTATERDALLARCRRSNMAIYATRAAVDERTVQRLGSQFGLERLDANWLAGERASRTSRLPPIMGSARHTSPIPTARSNGIPTAITTRRNGRYAA